MKVFVSLLFVAAAAFADTVLLNEVVDQAVASFNDVVNQAGMASLPLSEMSKEFPWKKKFIKITGQFHCWDGHAENLGTLYRSGDVVMTTEGSTMTLKLALGLGTLRAYYENCQAKVKNVFSLTQRMEVSVTSNSIEAQITLVKNGDTCTSNLDYIRLGELGTIKFDVGGSIVERLGSRVLEWFASLFKGDIVNGINSVLQDQGTANFAKADLCSKIPF